MKQYNGITVYEVKPFFADIYLDACLTGLGGAYGKFVYTRPIHRNIQNYNIAQLEISNIGVAHKICGLAWNDR